MKRPALNPQSRERLLQKHLILQKRRNHWLIALDHLNATPEEDRIGDQVEPIRQLSDLRRQLATLDQVLGIKRRSGQTKSQMVKRFLVVAGRKTNVSLE